MRPRDERENISAGKLASEASVQLRTRNATALRLAIEAAGLDIVQPRVRPRAIRRALKRIAPTLAPASSEAEAVLSVLARRDRTFGLYCARHPGWVAEQIAALQKTNGPTP